MRRILPVILLAILSSSCGIVRFGSSELFTAGPAIRADYTPQGIVEERLCPCSVPGPTQRRLIAYLPADYYTSGKNYPVIYLLHGARGYETSWIRFGEVYHTADSLWAKGKAAPCIIIMPNVNQYNDDRDYGDSRFKNAFESIFEVDGIVESAFMDDVVGYVDSVYRTIPDKAHRPSPEYRSALTRPSTLEPITRMRLTFLGLCRPICGAWDTPASPDTAFSPICEAG